MMFDVLDRRVQYAAPRPIQSAVRNALAPNGSTLFMQEKSLTLEDVLTALTDTQLTTATPLSSVAIDSRKVAAGSLFCAFVGERVDGHAYVSLAFEKGATAALVEQVDSAYAVYDDEWDGSLPVQIHVASTMIALQQIARYWRQQFPVRVIGITGSVGKTTTKELVYSVLSQRYQTLKSEGNFNNEIGLPLTLLNLKSHHRMAVLEMGMYDLGEIALLADIAAPDVGVVTLVGTVHVEHVGSQAALARGKRELVEGLSADGIAILNNDDPLVMGMIPYTKAAVFTYGMTEGADLWASHIRPHGINAVHFILNDGEMAIPVRLPLPGVHSVYTALRAAAVGLLEGLSWEEIVAGLEAYQTPLRMITKQLPNGATLIDDTYNASPQSMIAALDLLGNAAGRKVAVLGDMLELGVDEAAGHERVGRHAAGIADVLVVVGRRAEMIGRAAVANGINTEQLRYAADALAAVTIVQEIMTEEDTLLIKASRGIALDQLVSHLLDTHHS